MNRPPRGNEFRVLGEHLHMLEVKAQPVPNMTVRISEGSFWVNGTTLLSFLEGILQ